MIEDDARVGKEIADILAKQSGESGRDVITTWNDWLAWMCGVFDWCEIDKAGGITERLEECKEQSPLFFDAMVIWLELSDEKIRKYGAYDVFGALYEANYQSSFKASNAGQFFTPSSVCKMLARVADGNVFSAPTDKVLRFNDCACGSGRTLLMAWNECDKFNRNLFYAGDLDATSVYMCALNFMVHGMVGMVEKRDALTQEWYFGYLVNACKVPFANNFSCLQYFDDEKVFKKTLRGLEKNAEIWNCVCFRPKSEKNSFVVETCDKEDSKTGKRSEYVELSLFD